LPAAPWPSKRNGKLDQILDLVKDLGQKVSSQSEDIKQLKAQVGALEEENQVLREAVDGVSAVII
jgi:regulator of replication initiation timing